MACLFFLQCRVESHKLSLFVLWLMWLDALLLLPSLRTEEGRVAFHMLHRGSYKEASFYGSIIFLFASSPRLVDLVLTIIVYEPNTPANYFLTFAYMVNPRP